MKLEGSVFQNSNHCKGVSFAADAPLDIAVVEVSGRYPDAGFIYNEESHEMAYVAKGQGYFKKKGEDWQLINEGDVIYFKPEERFAWKSDGMTLVMPCSPQFDPNKHHEEEA